MSWYDRLIERASPTDTDTAKRAAVDVAASVALKDRHAKYGDMVRELAAIARAHYDPSVDKWNYIWAVTLESFSYWRRGYSVERAINALIGQFEGLVDRAKIERIVRAVYEQAPSIADRYGINRMPEKPIARRARR